MNKTTKGAIIGIAWLIVAVFGIWWIYDIITRQHRIDKIFEEGDRKILELDREYCRENPDDGSGYYKRHCDQFK